MSTVIQYILYLAVLVVLAIPLGAYIKKVMNGEKTFLSKILTPCENAVYKVMKVNKEEQMNWKKYAASVLIFSGIGLVFLFLLQLLQGVLPGNPQGLSGVKWDLSFNTAVSFITNTNWQAYSGESTLSYLTQALGLTVQNFVSAATGIAVLFALMRGFIKVKADGLGSFWVDMTRIVIHILLPLNLVISLLLVGGGVVQNLKGAETVSLVEPIAVSADGTILENAQINLETETVTVDGQVIEDAEIVTEQFVPMGPAASQVAIKQTGTNGGGFNGVNSAHPLENPNAFTNIIEMISLLLIPAALCFTFGSAVKNKKQGIAIFMAMFICLALALGTIAVSEQLVTPQLAQDGNVNISMTDQAGGNMEGKETRFGIASSSTWAAFTTAASNGSVNSMHASVYPLETSLKPNREIIHNPVVKIADIYTKSITGFCTCVFGFSFINESLIALPSIFLSAKALFVDCAISLPPYTILWKNSAIGPSASAGKKLSAPTSKTIKISKNTNIAFVVESVPAVVAIFFFPARLPAIASVPIIGRKRANSITSPSACVK
jgi:potassium-transporting ATPase potassium-binding subunit